MSSVLITGGHKGLGLEASRHIASVFRGEIVIAGRDLAEIEAVAVELRRRPGVTVKALAMDVSSLASVRRGASALKAMMANGEIGALKSLVLNAGAQFMAGPQYSVDGYEMTFATNCLGHFLLLHLLIDDIEDGGRIVFTASGTHDPATMDGKMVGKAAEPDAVALANNGKEGKPLSGGIRYSTSKLCDILYSYELDRRLRAAGKRLTSIAYDPGFVPETGLTRSAPAFAQDLLRSPPMKWLVRTIGVTPGSLAFSGEGLGRIAIDPVYATASGKYIQSSGGALRQTRSSIVSYDLDRAHKLWADSVKLARLHPDEISALLR